MKKLTYLIILSTLVVSAAAQLRFSVKTERDANKKTKGNILTLVEGNEKVDYTWNDTITRDPEITKVLFEKQKEDTLYALLYISTFSKVATTSINGRCVAGKEKRVFFVKWARKTNQAKWKNKCVESCLLDVTNMTVEENVTNWDKTSELIFKTHKANEFVDLTFDPNKFWEGLKSSH